MPLPARVVLRVNQRFVAFSPGRGGGGGVLPDTPSLASVNNTDCNCERVDRQVVACSPIKFDGEVRFAELSAASSGERRDCNCKDCDIADGVLEQNGR